MAARLRARVVIESIGECPDRDPECQCMVRTLTLWFDYPAAALRCYEHSPVPEGATTRLEHEIAPEQWSVRRSKKLTTDGVATVEY